MGVQYEQENKDRVSLILFGLVVFSLVVHDNDMRLYAAGVIMPARFGIRMHQNQLYTCMSVHLFPSFLQFLQCSQTKMDRGREKEASADDSGDGSRSKQQQQQPLAVAAVVTLVRGTKTSLPN